MRPVIPAGSFRKDSEGAFEFEGVVNGVRLEAKIVPLGGNSFRFEVEGRGVNLTGLKNPVPVELTIGVNTGSTTVMAESD